MPVKKRRSTAELADLRRWLAAGDLEPQGRPQVEALARRNRRALSFLTALTYDREALVAWRAVEALGWVTPIFAAEDPEYVRVHLRRLMWLLNDESGGIGWRAPEAMGEILRAAPVQFSEFIPILISLLDMEAPEDGERFRVGALWGIARVAEVAPQACQAAIPHVLACLSDEGALKDPAVPALSGWCLRFLDCPDLPRRLARFETDRRTFPFYWDGRLSRVTVAEIIQRALA